MTARVTVFFAGLMLLFVAGCETAQRAPVLERSGQGPAARPSQPAATFPKAPGATASPEAGVPVNKPPEVVVARTAPTWDVNDPRPDFHSVVRGETLFGIALAYGLTYREIADWNGLSEPYTIKIGQQLRLRPAQNNVTVIPAKPTAVDSTTIITDQTREAGALGGGDGVGQTPSSPPPATAPPTVTPLPSAQSTATPRTIPIKSEPKALKLPYNEANWSRFESEPKVMPAAKASAPIVDGSTGNGGSSGKPVEVSPRTEPAAKPQVGAKDAATIAESLAFAAPSAVVEGVEWAWPIPSKVTNGFSEETKGIALAGSAGQSVLASAGGQVSYVGNSLRGYGKMIVIKHNKMFLSVYARNSRVFVKEGQNVGKGQKIAEMGDTDSEGPVLHFEIRRYGKPVDPLKYLPNGAS